MELKDWFIWNGTKCTDYGMHVLSQPSIISPKERVSYETIPGKSGSITLLEGDCIYDDINLSAGCVIDDPYMLDNGESVSRIAKICGWLKGGGMVKFASRPEGYYRARVANQISFDKIVRGNPHRSFSVEFQAKPFLYLDGGDAIKTFTAAGTIKNEGNIYSEPLIKVYGTAEGNVMIGNSTMIINSFTNLTYICLDCEAKIAYKGSNGSASDPMTLLGTRVTGEWAKIPEGTLPVSFSGGITKIEITPRWRVI